MKNKQSICIKVIEQDKKRFLPLLLIGDEEEAIVDRYLEEGTLFALYDAEEVKAICVIVDLEQNTCELKNIAVVPESQRQGYGRLLLKFLENRYSGKTMLAGTGDSPLTVPFYKACGFTESHRIPHFFLEHYSHPIYEGGILLDDMVYFKKKL